MIVNATTEHAVHTIIEVIPRLIAAQLHDIGKIGIPDRILLKPGKLDEAEMEIMRSHPRRGHDILASVPDRDILEVATVVLHHHEGFDGRGYPDGLKGEQIPHLSRMVAIVDSFDALATLCPYLQPRTHAEIMEMLFGEHHHKYDPHLRTRFATTIEASPHKARVG